MKLSLDKKATIAGGVAGLGILTQVDFDKLPAPGPMAMLLTGLALTALGWLTNKKETKTHAKRKKAAKKPETTD